jgi:hypothetical protein
MAESLQGGIKVARISKICKAGLNELLKDVSSWNMNADGLYKQSTSSSNVKLSAQQNLLLKYSVAAQSSKRKLKA